MFTRLRLLTILVCFVNAAASAQTIYSSIINSSGGTFQSSSSIYIFSVGEPVVTSISNSTTKIRQGFLDMLSLSPVTGLDEIIGSEWSLYPNPTSGLFSISNLSESCRVEIIDTHGKNHVAPRFDSTIDISNFDQGIYMIRISDMGTKKTTAFKIFKH
jgi:hypothetical protein